MSISKRTQASRLLPLLLCAAWQGAHALDEKDITFSGVGWVQYGIVQKTTDTAIVNYNGSPTQSSGAQLSLLARISDRLEAAAGLGALESHAMQGGIGSGGRVPVTVSPYIAEARFTYGFWNSEESKLKLTGGLFPYNYNPDVQNLGLYLLRGPVYPGILISGFETKHVLPIANMLGFQLHHEYKGFQEDLLLNSETELYPFFDLSPAYVAGYKAGRFFRFGAGVNFYHLFPIAKEITSPEVPDGRDLAGGHPYNRDFIYVDSLAHDTTFLSFRGTKVMANFAFNPSSLFSVLGPEDLKLYGEAAIIGLDTRKAYKAIYGDLLHRAPIMIGCNIPTFKLLDHLSLEVEWYGAPYSDDLTRYLNSNTAGTKSPMPVANSDVLHFKQASVDGNGDTTWVLQGTNIPFDQASVEKNIRNDNWKWSLHGAKVIQGHFRISFQVANDHFRPGGTITTPYYQAAFTSPSDWYWMTKLAYFF